MEFKNYVINGVEVNITSLKELDAATNIRLHPMLSRLNRLDYLCTQQYTISTVGSHYVHQGDKKENVGFVGMQMDNANYIIFNDILKVDMFLIFLLNQ